MEVPNLSSSSIWSLDDHVSVVDYIKVSLLSHLRLNIEVSFNVEAEIFIKLSLAWFSFPFVNVHNIPHLVHSSSRIVNNYVSVFSINITLNIKHLSSFVLDEMIFISKELPPS